ncbi:Hypothetical protein FKW44_000305 [Caligus rogercresseyi]|uniref:Uncharacterized protein n=1 Tax=Caligus rogercresseyi TaxID=217165 RepID=A0A7T8KH59_CALRO|nr:Hypothetical protein FKW44_000305 [Caligus rogercresseyi]
MSLYDPPCETDSKEDDDSDGVHLQAEAGIDHCTTCWDHSRPEHHDRVPETTGKRFLSLKKNKIWLKDCLLMWTMHVPHCHRYQGVPDPEERGTGETVTLLTRPEPV